MQELLNVKAAGTYSNHSALKGLNTCYCLQTEELKPFPTAKNFKPKTEGSHEADVQSGVANDRADSGGDSRESFSFSN
jgi:hypothetical protein